jgi:hypothetical protein
MSEAKSPPKRQGKYIEVDDQQGTRIKVYPLGMRAMRDHPAEISTLVAAAIFAMEKLQAIEDGAPNQIAATAWGVLGPLVGREAMKLACACCEPDPMEIDAPQWVAAGVMAAWIEQSFLPVETKLKNWLAAADALVLQAAGRKVNFWNNLLQKLSPAASPAATSSTPNGETPTPAGASPSSEPTKPPSGASATPGDGK